LLIFLAAFIQATLIPFNWLLGLVLTKALIVEGKKLAWLAFLSGLILDLFLSTPWGLSSAFFLVISWLTLLSRRRFFTPRPLTIFLLAFFFHLSFDFFVLRSFNFSQSLIFSLVFDLFFALFLAQRIKVSKGLRIDLK